MNLNYIFLLGVRVLASFFITTFFLDPKGQVQGKTGPEYKHTVDELFNRENS